MRKIKPALNVRPLLSVAVGLLTGIYVTYACLSGSFSPAYLVFPVFYLCFLLYRPAPFKRTLAVFLCFLVCIGLGSGLFFGALSSYSEGTPSGRYEVTGSVVSVTRRTSYSYAVLDDLELNGIMCGGKLSLYFSGELSVGDLIMFEANVTRYSEEDALGDGGVYLMSSDIRYRASCNRPKVTGKSVSPFLCLNDRVYRLMTEHMTPQGAEVSYALLTGSMSELDDGFSDAVRKGGIAHIFAVSGLHIGILFAAISLLFRRIGKWKVLPAVAVCIIYSAFCSFSVSSVRAVVMCAVLGFRNAGGRKTDFLESLSFAAIVVLLFSPVQALGAGFMLSFGACVGLALLSVRFRRAFCRLPAVLAQYLSAMLSVQIALFPVMLASFGYYSVWGAVLNFFFIPFLPVLFLGLLLCTVFAMVFPFWAWAFLLVPESLIAVVDYVFSVADFSFALKGFSLGAAGAVLWYLAVCCISDKLRMGRKMRIAVAAVLCLSFSLSLVMWNTTPTGCKVIAKDYGEETVALVQTRDENVLVITEGLTLRQGQDFVSRHVLGEVTAVVLLSSDGTEGLNTALFLGGKEVRTYFDVETGVHNTTVLSGECFSYGELKFRYMGSEGLLVFAENVCFAIGAGTWQNFAADFLIGNGCGDLIFYMKDDIIISL